VKLKRFSPYLYLLPAAVIVIVFRLYPVLFTIRVSFYEWGIAGVRGFLGFSNYVTLFHDQEFWNSLLNTFYYVIGLVPASLVISLVIAILLNNKLRGIGFYRTVHFLPVVTSLIAVAMVWQWIYHPTVGLANYIMELLHVPAQSWLSEPRGIFQMFLEPLGITLPTYLRGPSLALVSIILMSIWKGLGYNVVIFLAGLQNIPQQYYEAARIDGASQFGLFRHVTWPLLSPITFYVLIITTITSFQVFGQVWLMTQGGPLRTTNVIVYYLYDRAFNLSRYGMGATIAFVVFIIVLMLTLVQRRIVERRVYYE
jgi:multiple sugar transport system permease protein